MLNHEQVGWNENLLHELFNEADVRAILRTPFSIMGLLYKLIWPLTKIGQYSINSRYKMAKNLERVARGNKGSGAGRDKGEEVLWKRIWSLNIKKKVQHFIWRACHNKIPVEVNLKKRDVKEDDRCKQCGEGLETIKHLFFHCPKVQIIWKLDHVHWDGLEMLTVFFKDWWWKQGESRNNRDLDKRQELTAYLI